MFGMTCIEPASEILKTDKRGRVWRSREQREQLLEEFDRSGLSGPKFASLTGLKYQTLVGWLHKRRQLRTQTRAVASASCRTPTQWFETVIDKTPSAASSALIVRFPSEAAIEVVAPGQAQIAAALLRAWEKTVC